MRHALRQFRTQRQFTIAALLVLGLGIGANATIFTVVDRVLLTPLPYHAPDDLVMIWEKNVPGNFAHNVVNPQNYLDWKDRSTSFSDMAAFTWSQMVLLGSGAPERVYGRSVTPNLFALLGARPALGRTFTAEESRPKGPNVVILSDKLWRRRYAADPQIVGKTIEVSGGNPTVVGVMPASFRPLSNEEYWDPFALDPSDRSRHGRYVMAIGRLKPGVTRAQAEADVTAIGAQLEKEYPAFDTGWRASVVGLADEIVGSSKSVILVLFGAVSLVLLITCANVGNLMLTRAASRRREVAVRTALGATRWRLAREWLVENLILALAGGAIGLTLTAYAVDLLVAASPSGVPRLHEIALDGRVIAATALVTIVVGLVIGAPAALQERTTRLAADLQGASTRTAGSVQAARFRSVLVVAQMSLAVVLLLASGLLVRSVARLAQVDPGFDPKGVLTLGVTLPSDKYPDLARQAAFFNEFSARLAALPGVEKVGAVSFLPLQAGNAGTGFDGDRAARARSGHGAIGVRAYNGSGVFRGHAYPGDQGARTIGRRPRGHAARGGGERATRQEDLAERRRDRPADQGVLWPAKRHARSGGRGGRRAPQRARRGCEPDHLLSRVAVQLRCAHLRDPHGRVRRRTPRRPCAPRCTIWIRTCPPKMWARWITG